MYKRREIKKMTKILNKKCATCKREFTTKHITKAYCKECYSIKQKAYREKDRGYYLYIILNKDNKVLYVGSTEHLYSRLHSHINCNSNIKELMQTDKWDKIKYLDVTNLVYNREELNCLENMLIEIYETEWNTKLNIIKNIDKLREFSLGAELHSTIININFKTYITRKEYQHTKKRAKK